MKTIHVLLAAVFGMIGSAGAAEISLAPGETLDWSTLDPKPTKDDTLTATGGTITNLSGDIPCRINVGGEVTVRVAEGELPQFWGGKIVKTDDSGRLVFDSSVKFYGTTGAYSYVDDDVIAFSDAVPEGTKVVFSGYTTCRSLPQLWDIPVEFSSGTVDVLHGYNPISEPIALVRAVSGNHTLRVANVGDFPEGLTVTVPEKTILNVQPMTLTTSLNVSTIDDGTTRTFKSNINLDGGRFEIGARCPLTVSGDISGTGEVRMNAYAGTNKGGTNSLVRAREFTGSLERLSPDSQLTVEAPDSYGWDGNNYTVRVSSGFPGTVVLEGDCETNTVSFGVVSFSEMRTVSFGTINSVGKAYASGTATLRGALLQINQGQRWHVGTLSGEVGLSTPEAMPSVLEIGYLADNTDLWIRYGVMLKVGSIGKNVKLHYLPNSNRQSNALEQTGEGAFAEIEFLSSSATWPTLTMTNVAAESVTGRGRIVAAGGTCRFARVSDDVQVDVTQGTVRFGALTDLATVLAAQSPALWLDASETTRMEGAWNAKWETSTAGKKVLKENPKKTFNEKDTATFKNCPLIEKWFDKRLDQNKTYGWQYRNYGYDNTLYTLVYPYLVENGLNGKPYMCFGSMGDEMDTEKFGLNNGTTSSDYKEERRRMPFMEDMWDNDGTKNVEGHAIRSGTSILVFGSQNGGGRAMLGGYSSTGTGITTSPNGRKVGDLGVLDGTHDVSCANNFPRAGTSSTTTVDTPIFTNNLDTWLDGVPVDPTVTGYNGGWQIVSFNDPDRKFVRSLGMNSRYAYAGGQNYAEILIFSNVLPARNRQAIEEYLALKWGLPIATRRSGGVSVAKGAMATGLVTGATGEGLVLADAENGVRLDGALSLFSDGTTLTQTLLGHDTLELPTELTVNVDLTTKLPAGSYTIVSADNLTGAESVTVNVNRRSYTGCVTKSGDGNSLVLTLSQAGSLVLIR